LTYFLISIVVLVFFVNCSTVEAPKHSTSPPANHHVGHKVKKATPAIRLAAEKVKSQKVAVQTNKSQGPEGDQLVCGAGQNLGLMQHDQFCRNTHYTRCREMLEREKDLPKYSRVANIRATLSRLNGNALGKKHKKKFSLKGRHIHKKKAEAKRKALTPYQRKQIEDQKAAKHMLKHMLEKKNKRLSAKNVSKVAKKLGGKYAPAKVTKHAVEKILKSRMAKNIMKSEIAKISPVVKKPAEVGDFCVHAVEYNLNYCCYFKHRSEAQDFANTQPDENTFNKMLYEGKSAEKRENEKRARRAAKKVAKALAALKIVESLKHPANRKSEKAPVKNRSGKSSSKSSNSSKSGSKKPSKTMSHH